MMIGIDPATANLESSVARFKEAAISQATRRAYRSDLRYFEVWCRNGGVSALPATPRTVARYLVHLTHLGLSVSTIDRRVAAIAFGHHEAGFDSPTRTEDVRLVVSGIHKTSRRPVDKKQALTADLIAGVVGEIPSDLPGLRDRALLLLAFGGALRRSELVSLQVSDLERRRAGLLIRLGLADGNRSDGGDQIMVLAGHLGVPAAVDAWLAASGIADGPVFRGCDRGKLSPAGLSAGQFARIVKKRCAAAGLDADEFSGSSARQGFATSAGDAGANFRQTMQHLRHISPRSTLACMEQSEDLRGLAGRSFL